VKATLIEARRWIDEARHIVIFTGAGMSAESGIPTFRDRGGLWDTFPAERFATLPGILRVAQEDPLALARFFLGLLEPVVSAHPNPGHRAVADLQARATVTVVTQNVDGLHQEAGSTDVHEIHGTLFKVALATGKTLKTMGKDALGELVAQLARFVRAPPSSPQEHRPALGLILAPYLDLDPGFSHRPQIVLFGEILQEPAWSLALKAVENCDLMIMVGTSGEVFPANILPEKVHQGGGRVIGIGPDVGEAELWIQGPAGGVLPLLLERNQ
jgi:NAD-dependent deacetylase